ncbi:E3 ubiquitin-protein ligase CBL-C isoform X2 [Cololabis saira]|uniref:E3 ubiquitin-protein ligase CBL-C isoform X2 n=1 Tax=Cololabis saira TaxID=129043 RepID=UPI002AD214D1|nr:E3 ubiquitin-protein ligase CBL-C isoform X2 [Cololabis saira]
MMAGAGGGASKGPKLSTLPPASGDWRLMDRSLRKLDKLHDLCTNPQLGLRNSPPYLPDLVRQTATLMEQVREPYQGSRAAAGPLPRGPEARYLRVHLRNLLDKTERALLLFKHGREKIFDETSSYRKNLTKLSLLFSHMLWELKAMFPGGYFQGDTYKVTKTEADEFWRRSFGNKCIVEWNNFKEKLRSVHPFEEGMESMALKSTIDLVCNDHISVFEFDIFTSLFQPWRSLMRNWNQLAVTHPGYMAFLTYDQVIHRLENYLRRPGSYIFRPSCTRMGQWAIGHVTAEGDVVQTIPQNMVLYQALIQGFKEGCYLYPDGHDVNPDLTSLCEPTQKDKVTVTEEQYELYCEMGSTFQLCKICAERDKDTRIKPCGHLLCRPCLTGWQSAGHTCPYCRCNIRGTESVLVEPYLQDSSRWEEEGDEEGEEEDHEDIQLLKKEMAALKFSSLGHQVAGPHASAPPLPPKDNSPSQYQSPTSQSQMSETVKLRKHLHSRSAPNGKEKYRRKQKANSTAEENFMGLRSNSLTYSAEFLGGEEIPSSALLTLDSGIAWMGPPSPARERRHMEKEEQRAMLRKNKTGLGEIARTMSS